MENTGETLKRGELFYPDDLIIESEYKRPREGGAETVKIDVVRVPGDTIQQARDYVNTHFIITDPTLPDSKEVQSYFAKSLNEHNQNVKLGSTELRKHQRGVFDDIAKHFDDGGTTGYVKLPTGTGKTVVFVELSKALIDNAPEGRKPKILVVTPTKDLVLQTVGEGMGKGFAKFAPDLKVSTYFSDSTDTKEASTQSLVKASDVCVTTYRSFVLMLKNPLESDFLFEYDAKNPDRRLVKKRHFRAESATKKVIDMFDFIIFDEGHRSLSSTVSQSIDKLKTRNTYMLGFTATPDSSPDRKLADVIGKEIHTMDIKEALSKELLAPIISFGIKTNVKVDEKVYNKNTDQYFDEILTQYLGTNEERNQLVVDSAKVLIEAGIPPVISCLPGRDLFHPKYIAELLNKTLIKDSNSGETRFAKVASVDSTISTIERKHILDAFEKGEYDALTFVNILGEGWDSTTAKGLINARPTRSIIFGLQRLGRILRLDEIGKPGVVIDLIDSIGNNNSSISPANTADLLEKDSVMSIGEITCKEGHSDFTKLRLFSTDLESSLRFAGIELQSLETDYTKYSINKIEMDQSINRNTSSRESFNKNYLDEAGNLHSISYSTLARMFDKELVPGITSRIFENLEFRRKQEYTSLDKKVGNRIHKFYAVGEIIEDISKLPEINPTKYVKLNDGSKWATAKAFEKILKSKISWVSEDLILDILDEIQNNGELDYDPVLVKYKFRTKTDGAIEYGVAQLFKLDTYKQIAKYLVN